MPDLAATEPAVVAVQPLPGSEGKQLIPIESAGAAAGSTSPTKQNEEPLDQLPMTVLESPVEKPTKIAAKRLLSPASTISVPSFASFEPKKGPPSLSWESFKHPQLRRFPGSFTTHKLRCVGDGVDGIVFKTKTDGGDTVAMKIVRYEDSSLNHSD